jgi:hypothetical protein
MTGIITRTMTTTITTLSIALMLTLSTSSVYAAQDNAYHHEAEVGFLDSSDSSDGLLNLNYNYYFEPVNQTDVPYALAPFLNQYSTLSARYAVTDNQDLYNIAGEYVFDSKFFIGGDYTKMTTEGGLLNASGDDQNSYGANLGYYFTKQSKLTLSYAWQSDDETKQFESEPFGNRYYSYEYKSDLIKLAYQHYLPFESTSGLMLNGFILHSNDKNDSEYTIVEGQDDNISSRITNSENSLTVLGINADWYITDSWSVGGLYTHFNSDYDVNNLNIITTPDTVVNDNDNYSNSNSANVYSVNTRYFWHFSDVFSAKFSLEQYFDNGEYGSDSETNFGVAINARF